MLTAPIALYFLYYFQKIGITWSTGQTYGLVGLLFFLITYDLFRYFIPRNKYKNLWLYEHIYKMVVSFNVIFSAFIGTVLPKEFEPYSQFLPSIIWTVVAGGFTIHIYKRTRRTKLNKHKEWPKTDGGSTVQRIPKLDF